MDFVVPGVSDSADQVYKKSDGAWLDGEANYYGNLLIKDMSLVTPQAEAQSGKTDTLTYLKRNIIDKKRDGITLCFMDANEVRLRIAHHEKCPFLIPADSVASIFKSI